MTTGPALPRQISVDGQQAANLATLLRELERFLDECDETTADAIADFFALHPAAEAYSAALCFHADTLEAALGLGTAPTDAADHPKRHVRALDRSGKAAR